MTVRHRCIGVLMTREGYVTIRTDLRYVVELPDGQYFITDNSGNLCLIGLTKKKGMRTFFKDKTLGALLEPAIAAEIVYHDEHGVMRKGYQYRYEWKVNDPNTGDQILVLQGFFPDGNEEYVKFYSRLHIVFPVEDIDVNSAFMEQSLSLIDKLVGIYRLRNH